MGKLVRDLIPDIIRSTGREPVVRQLNGTEYLEALDNKLLEEAAELQSADPADRLEEAADVYEVLVAIANSLGVGIDGVAHRAQQKRRQRGGFDRRLWLEM